MEIVITIALLIVPVISLVSLYLAVRATARQKAMKSFVMKLTRIVDQQSNKSPVESAVESYTLGEM